MNIMAEELIMPKLSMTMEEGQIVNWLVDEGDAVEEGEVILEVLSDKTNFEVEAPASGVLLKKFYEADDVVPVTEVIGYIGEEGEDIEDLIADKADEAKAGSDKEAEVEDKEETAEKTEEAEKTPAAEKTGKEFKDEIITDKIKTVPAVRRIAEENNIDLHKVKPTGENNVIEVRDIENYMAEMEKEKGTEIEAYREKLSGIRKASAKKVKESWTDIPHVTVTSEVNMEKIIELKDSWNQMQKDDSLKVSITDLLIKIVAVAMERHTIMNAYMEDDVEVVHNEGVNIGLAVSVDDKLTVPVFKNLEAKNIKDIVKEKKELVEKARNNKLKSDEITGGSLTISNLGMYGTEIFTPIINAPQSGILGVGTIKKKPVVVDDEITIKPMMWLSLAFDHRLVEGAPAAAFLKEIKDLLEFPAKVMF